MWKSPYNFTFVVGIAIVLASVGTLIFDSLDRTHRGGEICILLCLFLLFSSLYVLLRILWQVVCNKLIEESAEKKLLFMTMESSVYDAIPLLILTIACSLYDITCLKIIWLPFIVLVLNALFLTKKMSQKKLKMVFTFAITMAYFFIGMVVFSKNDFLENAIYLVAHFLPYFFPLVLLLYCQKLLFVPMLLTCVLKGVFGRFSSLDLFFIPMYLTLTIVFMVLSKKLYFFNKE